MAPKIHPIFSQELDNGETGEFAIGDDGKAYWNGKPIVTEEKVVLQLWVNIALIVTALAVVGQMIFAGLAYLDSHKVTQKTGTAVEVSATEQPGLFPLLAGYPCDKEGKMFVSAVSGVLACTNGELKPPPAIAMAETVPGSAETARALVPNYLGKLFSVVDVPVIKGDHATVRATILNQSCDLTLVKHHSANESGWVVEKQDCKTKK